MLKIIGITGAANAGKDTLGGILGELDQRVQLISFAMNLKLEVAEAFDVPLATLNDRATKEEPQSIFAAKNCRDKAYVEMMLALLGGDGDTPRSPREVMQLWGTEYRRGGNKNYWVDSAFDSMQQGSPDTIWIFTDVRFDNERHLIDREGGVLIHISRPGAAKVRAHDSEIPVQEKPWDLKIVNDGTLEDIRKRAEQAMNYIKAAMFGRQKRNGPTL